MGNTVLGILKASGKLAIGIIGLAFFESAKNDAVKLAKPLVTGEAFKKKELPKIDDETITFKEVEVKEVKVEE